MRHFLLSSQRLKQVGRMGVIMSDEIQYKGYTIQATPDELSETKRWTVDIIISKERNGTATDKQFSANHSYPTEDEAKRHCLEFGRQIIDGKHPGSTLP